jgi:hypothetical protein
LGDPQRYSVPVNGRQEKFQALAAGGQRAGIIRYVVVMVPQTGYESSCLAGGIDNESFRFGHAEIALERRV